MSPNFLNPSFELSERHLKKCTNPDADYFYLNVLNSRKIFKEKKAQRKLLEKNGWKLSPGSSYNLWDDIASHSFDDEYKTAFGTTRNSLLFKEFLELIRVSFKASDPFLKEIKLSLKNLESPTFIVVIYSNKSKAIATGLVSKANKAKFWVTSTFNSRIVGKSPFSVNSFSLALSG